jgi:hypothetical protein
MTFTRKLFVTTATILAMAYGAAEASQLRGTPGGGSGPTAGIGKIVGTGPVRDTCDQSYPGSFETCDPDSLTQRCDDAGGGMSSLPGGGIDCDIGD